METRLVKGSSPVGIWTKDQLIGANVRIVSLSIWDGLFGYDSDKTWKISDIGYRITSTGKATAAISLEGIENRTFEWKDLMIISLRHCIWSRAITNQVLSGETLVGYLTKEE